MGTEIDTLNVCEGEDVVAVAAVAAVAVAAAVVVADEEDGGREGVSF